MQQNIYAYAKVKHALISTTELE